MKTAAIIFFLFLSWFPFSSFSQVITLHIAIQQGDFNKVAGLIENGTDVNLTDRFGNTALTIAAWNGQFEILKYLVEHGANINAADERGFTPLLLSATKGNYEIVQYLVQQGALPDEQGPAGRTALLAACIGHSGYINPDVVSFLVKYSTNVNQKDQSGKTALDYASTDEIRQILISYGAVKGNEIK
jgi:ankyrin repeat protein